MAGEKHWFEGTVELGVACDRCGDTYESNKHHQSLFDRIAHQPREGDTLIFPGGHLIYAIEDRREWPPCEVIATRIKLVKRSKDEPFETQKGYITLDERTWHDLVQFAASAKEA